MNVKKEILSIQYIVFFHANVLTNVFPVIFQNKVCPLSVLMHLIRDTSLGIEYTLFWNITLDVSNLVTMCPSDGPELYQNFEALQ